MKIKSQDKIPTFMICIIILMIALFLIWSAFTEVDEISRGDGRVIPATRTQTIQATESGVVQEIHIKIGQTVRKGDLIIRLDDTTTASELGEVEARIRGLRATVARLKLEESGDSNSKYLCPETVFKVAPEICSNEAELFIARMENKVARKSVLEQRLLQRQKEFDEAQANITRLNGVIEITTEELRLITNAAQRKLVAQTELIRVQRESNQLKGELNITQESLPRLEGAIKEARLQIEELELQARQELLAEKTVVLSELSVLEESARGSTSRVERTDILSPVDGVINTMEINTIGAFVQPGDTVAEIVPTSEELVVEARISPNDVAFVVPGQSALVKITAFDFSIFGGLQGEVVNVSPDSLVDQNTGEPYFEVRVKTAKSQLKKGDKIFNITPGMVSSVDILTGRKTILQYLLKPINKARQEALTER